MFCCEAGTTSGAELHLDCIYSTLVPMDSEPCCKCKDPMTSLPAVCL